MIYFILNYQINKQVTRVILCYLIINGIVFEFIIFYLFIIRVMFKLTNTIKNLLSTRTKHDSGRSHEVIINTSKIWWKKIKQNYLFKMNNIFFQVKIFFYQLLKY